MAATVTTIMTEIKSLAASSLGNAWHELPNSIDLKGNDSRRGSKGYGVRPLGAADAPSVTNSYSLDHVFEVVLMDRNPRKDDESQAMAVLGDLYDKQDEIYKSLVRTKVNLGGTVLLVSNPSLSDPEFVNGREFVALRQQFNVRYRQTI
jgi:hypothetical protein